MSVCKCLHTSKLMNVREYRRNNKKIDNRENLVTHGTQDEERKHQKHNTICVGHHCAQTNTNNVNKT